MKKLIFQLILGSFFLVVAPSVFAQVNTGYDQGTGSGSGGTSVSDAVYDATWNGDTTHAPSKNSVYDKVETISGSSGGWTDGGTEIYQTTTTDNVGIGTLVPGALLGVGTTSQFKVTNAGVVTGVLTNATGLPLSTGITGFAAGVATALATPSSANLAAAVTDETGSGVLMFATAPTVTTSLTMANGANMIISATTGTKIGTGTTQKIGFYNSAPVAQQTGDACTALQNLGLVASCTTTSASGWTDTGPNVVTTTSTDNVGIGTTLPVSLLQVKGIITAQEIDGDTTGPLTITNANVGIGTNTAGALMAIGTTGQTTINSTGVVTATTFVGALTGTASGNLVSGGALGTPSSGTATNITGLPEAGLSLTDLTTNDVSITKHGFAPKAPNDVTKFLDGTGAYSTPSSSGGWTDGGVNVYTSTTTDNVGIGTTTPNAATLEIVKNAGQPLLKVSSTATSNGDYLTVLSAGNVGIGTTIPTVFLTVAKSDTTAYTKSGGPTARLAIANLDSTTANNYESLTLLMKTTANAMTAAAAIDAINTDHTSATSAADMVFKTRTANTFNEQVRITGVGNVGIGTVSPNGRLAVWGTGTGATATQIWRDSAGTQRAVVMDNGNVGIGTASPMNQLQVNGTVQVDGANNIGWSFPAATNQACNTTCVSSCVFGWQLAAGAILQIVDCTDATADQCLCAGPS